MKPKVYTIPMNMNAMPGGKKEEKTPIPFDKDFEVQLEAAMIGKAPKDPSGPSIALFNDLFRKILGEYGYETDSEKDTKAKAEVLAFVADEKNDFAALQNEYGHLDGKQKYREDTMHVVEDEKPSEKKLEVA